VKAAASGDTTDTVRKRAMALGASSSRGTEEDRMTTALADNRVVTEVNNRMITALADNRVVTEANNRMSMALGASSSRDTAVQETTTMAVVEDMELTTTSVAQLIMLNSMLETLETPTCSPVSSTISARTSKTLETSRSTSKMLSNLTNNFSVAAVDQASLQAPALWALRLLCRL
jgi:hypothetical protein